MPVRIIKSFSTLRPNPSNTIRTPFLGPRRVTQPLRRRYAVETKTTEPVRAPSSASPVDETKLPLTQRLRILFKKYRWPALTIYFGLSVLDFGVAFIGVRAFGTERIGRYEKIILKKLEDTFGWKTKGTPSEHTDGNLSETASIWTEIALAYTIHKTLFALIRVPLTVAITPSLVKWFHRKEYGVVLAQLPAVGRLFQNNAVAVAKK
jgi:N-terminal acetyltransferase 2